MADCFCGCERSVASVGHKRRANKLGSILTDAIPVGRGALVRLPEFADDAELKDLIATGPGWLEQITAYVHGDIGRDAVDADALNDWHERWTRRYKEILKEMGDWVGLNPFLLSRVVLAGERAQAMIVDVRDTGVTVNEDPRVELLLRVEPTGAPAFDARRKVVVSRIAFPLPGGQFEVAYDPDDLEKVTFRRSAIKEVAISQARGSGAGPG